MIWKPFEWCCGMNQNTYQKTLLRNLKTNDISSSKIERAPFIAFDGNTRKIEVESFGIQYPFIKTLLKIWCKRLPSIVIKSLKTPWNTLQSIFCVLGVNLRKTLCKRMHRVMVSTRLQFWLIQNSVKCFKLVPNKTQTIVFRNQNLWRQFEDLVEPERKCWHNASF